MFCILAIVFPIAVACLANGILPIRGNSNTLSTNVKSRRQQYAEPFAPPSQTQLDDPQLLDIVIVASVDGKLHALNRSSGQTLWSMSTASTASVPPALAPLVRTSHIENDPDVTDDDSRHQELYVIEPQTGDIYVMATPTSPLQPLSFSMSQLVDMSPFSFTSENDERSFVGKKETSLLLVELETGKVKATLNSECPWNPFEDLTPKSTHDSDLDELEDDKPPVSTSTEVFIGRTGKSHSFA
jgi:serine/threonine-protein kinase/endoribonuclease IRE1